MFLLSVTVIVFHQQSLVPNGSECSKWYAIRSYTLSCVPQHGQLHGLNDTLGNQSISYLQSSRHSCLPRESSLRQLTTGPVYVLYSRLTPRTFSQLHLAAFCMIVHKYSLCDYRVKRRWPTKLCGGRKAVTAKHISTNMLHKLSNCPINEQLDK